MANEQILLSLGINVGPALSQLDREFAAFERRRPLKINLDTTPIRNATNAFNAFDQTVERVGKRVLAFGASVAVLEAVRRGVEESAKAFIKLDVELAKINLNFNVSQAKLTQFGKSLFDIARNTGQTIEEVTKAANELSKQGLSLSETLNRTSAALILTRQSGLSLEESIEAITSTIKEFSKESLNANDVINRFASTEGKFAVSSKTIAEAVTRVGSAASEAGVSLNELIALITTASSVTQRQGSVIGTAFQQIFNSERKQATIDSFKSLGIAVESANGKFLPAIQILKNVAQSYYGLSDAQKQQVAQLVGGTRQLNILTAVLGDVNKKYGTYEQSLNAVNSATDNAIAKNDKLNKTFEAQLNSATQSLTQIGAIVGKLTLEPIFNRTIGNFNSLVKGIGSGSNSGGIQGLGAKIGEGILKGIGNALAGPGLVLGSAVIAKLVGQVGKYSFDAAKDLLKTNSIAEQQESLQQAINVALRQQGVSYQGLLSLGKDRIAQETFVLNLIKEQSAAKIGAEALSSSLAASVYARGGRTNGQGQIRFADGFLPNEIQSAIQAESAATSRNVGGGAGGRPVVIDNFSIGGQRQTIVANDREFFVPTKSINPAYSGPDQVSIVNPDMVSSMGGLPSGAIPVRAKGFIPNKATGNIPYDLASFATNSASSILPYILGGASAIGAGGIGAAILKSLFGGGKEGELTGEGVSGGDFYAKNILKDLLGPKAIKRRTKRGLLQTGRSFGLDVNELKQLTKSQIANRLNTDVLQQYPNLYHDLVKRGYVGNDDLTYTVENNQNLLKKIGIRAEGFTPQNFAFGTADLFKQGRSILNSAKNYNTYDDAVLALPQFKKNLKEYLYSRNPGQIGSAQKLITKLRKAGFGIEFDGLTPVQSSKDILKEGNKILQLAKTPDGYNDAKKIFPWFANNLQNYINSKNPNERDAKSIYNLASNLRRSGFGVDYSNGSLDNIINDFSSGRGLDVDTVRGTKRQQKYQQKLLAYMKAGMSERQAADRIVEDSYSDKNLNSKQKNSRYSLASQYLDEFPDFELPEHLAHIAAKGYVPNFAIGDIIGKGFQSTVYDAGAHVFKAKNTQGSIDVDQHNTKRGLQFLSGLINNDPKLQASGIQVAIPSNPPKAIRNLFSDQKGFFQPNLSGLRHATGDESFKVRQEVGAAIARRGKNSRKGFSSFTIGDLRNDNILIDKQGNPIVIDLLANKSESYRKILRSKTKSFAPGYIPKLINGLLYTNPDDFARDLKAKGHDSSYIKEQVSKYYGPGNDVGPVSGFSLPSDALNALNSVKIQPPAPQVNTVTAIPPVSQIPTTPIAPPISTSPTPAKSINFSPILLQEAAKIPSLDISHYASDTQLRQGIEDYYNLFGQAVPATVTGFGQTSNLDQGKISAIKKSFNVSGIDLLDDQNRRQRLFNNKGNIAPNILEKVKSQLQTSNTRFGNVLNDQQLSDLATEIVTNRLSEFDKEAIKQLQSVKLNRGKLEQRLNELTQKTQGNVLSNQIQDALATSTPLTNTQKAQFLKQTRSQFFSNFDPQQRRDPKTQQLADQIAQQELGIITSRISAGQNQREATSSNAEFTNGFLQKYGGFRGGATTRATPEIEAFVKKQVGLGADEGIVRGQVKSLQEQAQRSSFSSRSQTGLQASFLLPVLAGGVTGLLGNGVSSTTKNNVTGLTNSVAVGGAIASLGPSNPYVLGLAAAATALGAFKTALDNLGPSVEDITKANEEYSDKVQTILQGAGSYIQAQNNLNDIIQSGGTKAQIGAAQKVALAAFRQIPDDNLRNQLAGKTDDQQQSIIADFTTKYNSQLNRNNLNQDLATFDGAGFGGRSFNKFFGLQQSNRFIDTNDADANKLAGDLALTGADTNKFKDIFKGYFSENDIDILTKLTKAKEDNNKADDESVKLLQDSTEAYENFNKTITNVLNTASFASRFQAQGTFNTRKNQSTLFSGLLDNASDLYNPLTILDSQTSAKQFLNNADSDLQKNSIISNIGTQIGSIFNNKETDIGSNALINLASSTTSGIQSRALTGDNALNALNELIKQADKDGNQGIVEELKKIQIDTEQKLATLNQTTDQNNAELKQQNDLAKDLLNKVSNKNFAGGLDTFLNPDKFNSISSGFNTNSFVDRANFNLPINVRGRRESLGTTSGGRILLQQQENEANAEFGRGNASFIQSIKDLTGNNPEVNRKLAALGLGNNLSSDISGADKNKFAGLASTSLSGIGGLQGQYETAQARLQREAALGAQSGNFNTVLADLSNLRKNSNVRSNQNTLDATITAFKALNIGIGGIKPGADAQSALVLALNNLDKPLAELETSINKNSNDIKIANAPIFDSATKLSTSQDALNATVKELNTTLSSYLQDQVLITKNSINSSADSKINQLQSKLDIDNKTIGLGTPATIPARTYQARQKAYNDAIQDAQNIKSQINDINQDRNNQLNSVQDKVGVDAKVNVNVNLAGQIGSKISEGVQTQDFQDKVKNLILAYVKPSAINKGAPPTNGTQALT